MPTECWACSVKLGGREKKIKVMAFVQLKSAIFWSHAVQRVFVLKSSVPGNAVKASVYKWLVCCVDPELFIAAVNAGWTIRCETHGEAPMSQHCRNTTGRPPVF